MKFLSALRLRFVIAATLVVAMLMVGSALVELQQSRQELLHVLQEHAQSLAEIIGQSSANIMLSTEQVEQQLSERLLNNAYYIARLDSLGLLTAHDLRRFAQANDIYRINIFNGRGTRVLGSYDPIVHPEVLTEKMSPREVLAPILEGKETKLIIGLKQARFEEGQRYAVAIRRTKPGGGAIVLNLDAAQLLEFRKRIGIGKLIRDLGDNTGVDYVAIQDREGLLAATSRVKELSSIDHDSTLAQVLDRNSVVTRQTEFEGRQTYEVARRLAVEGTTVGVLRIGLSMEEIKATEERMTRRIVIMSIVLAAIGALIFTAVVVSQNYVLVSEKYSRMKSFTRNILLNMRDAVVALDGESHVTIYSRQAEGLFGVAEHDVVRKKIHELPPNLSACLTKVFADENPDLHLECRPGIRKIVSVSLSTATKPDGTLESRTAVIKDLTESRQLENELRRNEKLTAMGALASGVAHEIRNPLNAISMIAQRYDREFSPRRGLREYRTLTEVLKKESKRVNNIIHQFLAYARPPKLNKSQVPLQDFIEHVGTLFSAQARAKRIRFSAESQASATVTLDPEQMTQALLNLLQNALDATPDRGKISLVAGRANGSIQFSVTDSGIGIAKDKLHRIFDLYFTTKSKGTGMGLAITQQIITQHDGNIEVVSEPGKGSTFVIRIPA